MIYVANPFIMKYVLLRKLKHDVSYSKLTNILKQINVSLTNIFVEYAR